MSQAEQLITQHIDIWTAAIENKGTAGRGSNRKQSLYGIKKLRELILELAVRGLLVPQDPNDEPASELLEKTVIEKQKLIDEGKLKPQKELPKIEGDELVKDLPNGWSCARLGDVMSVLNGRAYKKYEMLQKGTPLLRVGNLFTSNEWYYSDLELEPDKYVDNGDLIYAWSASFGPFIWNGGKVIYHYHIWKLDLFNPSSFDKEYLLNYLQSITSQIKASGNGIAMLHMTKERMEKLVVPIAPFAEQFRISTKVNELMALCDQLEKQTEDSLDAHQTLVETLLKALLDAAQSRDDGFSSETAFEQAWQRTAEHFDVLFTTEHSIDQLKQTILQLAVMGKLVPQDPNDEPASVLLEKIAAEKERLVKEGKIKKQKPLPPISDEEKLFELPEGWEWERINTISIVGTGATPARDNPSYYTPAEFNWVTSGETSQAYIAETKEKVSSKAVAETNVTIYPPGTLVIAMYGQGKTRGQITELLIPAGTNQACAAMQLVNETDYHRAYIKLYFQKAYEDIRSIAEGGAQPNLNVGKVSKTVIPLPPIQEQQRIVEKVDALMSLCDSLRVGVREAQNTQLHLANAMAGQALN